MNDFIEARGISFSYAMEDDPNPIRVFENLDFTIGQGELVAILGHNGSGKSTLAKHFNAILLPDEGQLTVDGMDTQDNDKLYDIRQKVGMVFQNPDNQIVATVVEEDVAFGLENMGVEPSEIRRRVDQALESVGISEYKTHAPHRLSGGQKQRVAIAGVIAMRPQCIVLDEPTAMLDPIGREEVISTVTRLCREKGMTVVLITHHMDECVGADRLIVMSNGSIVADGVPAEVFADIELMEREGLTVPETTRLLYDLKQRGMDLPLTALDVDACAKEIVKQLRG